MAPSAPASPFSPWREIILAVEEFIEIYVAEEDSNTQADQNKQAESMKITQTEMPINSK